MVAIVAGNGLGLFNASNALLGSLGMLGQGGLGQSRGIAYVNAANGNLLLQFQDQQLSGRNADLLPVRTYNSQGTSLNDGLGTGWLWDAEARVLFAGNQRNVDGTVTRTTGDGHATTYTWNGTAYVSTEGSGAHDSMRFESGQWVWTNGSTRVVERYSDAVGNAPGRLQSVTDTSGNVISFTFDAGGRLTSVLDNGSGQKIVISYTTVANVLRIDHLDTFEQTVDSTGRATGVMSTVPVRQVQYVYDTAGRLDSVRTVLNPGGATPSYYNTKYTYDGASARIASVAQSDGTNSVLNFASFTYAQVGNTPVWRIASVTDASGTQQFTYNAAVNGRKSTDITDAAGKTWTYVYDAVTSQLLEIDTPAMGGARIVTQFEYDASGNLVHVIDARGTATYEYDARGNQTLERDAFGNTITRTFDALTNQVITETHYTVPNPQNNEGALTARYVYDGQSRLRFLITAEGRVSENRYTSAGLLARSIHYAASAYDVSTLGLTDAPTEAQMVGWVSQSAVDKSKVELTDYTYDPRGNLSRRTDFATVGANGEGVLDAAATVTEYIDDGHGRLLKTIAMRGGQHDQPAELTSYAYDGLGREISSTTASGTHTTVFNDAVRQIQITTAANLRETRTFDTSGRLSSVSRVDISPASATYAPPPPRKTKCVYDAAGRLQIVQEITGQDAQGNDIVGPQHFSFYDALGRLQYAVDATGGVTGLEYNANGQVIAQTAYTQRANTASWNASKTTLTIGSNGDINADPLHDRRTTSTYDSAGRLRTQTDAANVVTTTTYDAASRVTQVSTGNRVTRYFYDRDGRQVGVVDPLGYLTENKYDAAGRLVETVRYRNRSPNAVNTSGPVWTGVTGQVANVGRPFVYQLPVAYDPDGDEVIYSAVGSLPAWLTFDATSLTLRGTPPAGTPTQDITLSASDVRGGVTNATTNVTVRITVANAPPRWANPLPDATVATNTASYSLQLPAATDAESTAAQLTYSVDPALLPPGLTFTAATRKFTGTPTTAGTYVITVRVTDPQGLFSEKTFVLQVTNRGPSFPTAPADVTATRAQALNYTLAAAVDPESKPLTYRIVSGPSWLRIGETSHVLTGTPPAGAAIGPQAVRVEAQDPFGETAILVFSINVLNAAPVWAATLPQPAAFHAGAQFNYVPPAATDPEGGAITYTATGLPSGFTLNAQTGAISGHLNQAGSWQVTITATDPAGGSVSRMITINQTNNAPVYVGNLVDVYMQPGSVASQDVPHGTFVDPDGDVMGGHYMASTVPPDFIAGLIDSTFLLVSPATIPVGTVIPITVGVQDILGAAAYHTFNVIIVAPPPPPGGGGGGPSHPPGWPPTVPNAAPLPRLPQAGALVPAVDVLAAWRPASSDDLHSYRYYDAEGRLVGSVDERGFVSATVYDSAANVQETVNYMTQVTVGADDTFDLLKGRAGEARITRMQFDSRGRLSTTTSIDGTVTRLQYDDAGRTVRTVQADGVANEQRATRTRYDAFGDVTGTLSGVGDAWLVANPGKTLDEAIAQYGMRYRYDSLGRRISATDAINPAPGSPDANGRTTLQFFDAQGRLTHIVNAKGEVTRTVYNAFGQVESTRLYNTRLTPAQLAGLTGGSETTLIPLLTVDVVKDRVTTENYDQRGLLTSSTDALGFTTTNTYDAFGQVATQVRTILQGAAPTTVTTQYGYDLRGQILAQTNDAGGLNFNSQTRYDAYGRIVSSADAAGRVLTTSYLNGGRVIEITDPLNRRVHREYDAFSRLLKQIDAVQMTRAPELRKATTYEYDDTHRRVIVTTPENVQVTTIKTRTGETLSVSVGSVSGPTTTTTYAYNKDGQVTTVTDALGQVVTTNVYDNRGRLDTTADARGTVTKFTYDELNRVVTRQVDPTGLNLTTKYEFNAFGEQITVTEAFGTSAQRVTSYSYDAKGAVLQVVVDPTGLKLSTTYQYDGVGNTLQVAQGTVDSPNQLVTQYVFDKLGRRVKEISAPSAVLGAGSARTRDITTEYRYSTAGQVSRTIDANGQSTWFVYDAAGQLTETINALGEVTRNSYDANGRVIQTRSYLTRVSVAGFGDVVNSVAPVANNNDQRMYFVYDDAGRQRFTVRAEIDSDWSATETRFDANGNVVETRAYDLALAEASITADDTTASPGLSVAEISARLRALGYKDTALGSTTTDETTLANVHRTRFLYDADNRLRFTVDGLGDVTEREYDAAGNPVTIRRYATPVPLAAYTYSALNDAVDRTNRANQVSHFAYDKAGRQVFAVSVLASDAQGHATQQVVTEQIFDAASRVTQTISRASVLGTLSNDYSVTAIRAALDALPVNTQDRRVMLAYDTAGRQVYGVQVLTINDQGQATQHIVKKQTYDALGHVIKSTSYAALIPLSGYDLATLDAAVGANSVASDARNRTTQFAYDAAGRLRFTVLPDGTFTEAVYDALGRVTEKRRFDLYAPPGLAIDEATLVGLRAARQVGDGVTRGERYTYDLAGRVLTTTDAKNAVESSVYNGLGQMTSHTDRNGKVWTYTYDRVGRSYDVITPSVEVTLINGTIRTGGLRTRFYYDVFGNVITKAEGLNTGEDRLTRYTYDRLGRQITMTLPGWYDPVTERVEKATAAGNPTGRFQRTLDTTYDALGNSVSTKLRIGASSYQYEQRTYDLLGRVVGSSRVDLQACKLEYSIVSPK